MTWFTYGRHERGREMLTLPLLQQVGLLKFYEEATSLKGHGVFLRHLICRWNSHQQAFRVGPNQCTCPLRRKYISLQGYRGEGWIFPRSQRFQLAMQQGVSWCTPRDTLAQIYFSFIFLGIRRSVTYWCIWQLGGEVALTSEFDHFPQHQ